MAEGPKKERSLPPSPPAFPGMQEPSASTFPGGEDDLAFPETSPAFPQESPFAAEEKPLVPEQTIRVFNGSLTYLISNRGAVLHSVTTGRVKDADGNPMELIKHLPGAAYPLTLQTGNAAINRALAQSLYATDAAPEVTLSPVRPKAALVFHLQHPTGLTVTRTISFEHQNPLFRVETQVDGRPFARENLQYEVIWGPGLGGAQESQADFIVFSGPTTFVNKERLEDRPGEMESNRITHTGEVQWTGFQNKYFATALVPEQGIRSSVVEKRGEDEVYVGLVLDSVQSNASGTNLVYVGTKELQVLEDSGHDLVRLIDYGWFGNKFAFLVKPILKALNFFHDLTNNYGWSIIFLTCVVKLVFFPLTHKSFKSMKGMQKVQPYVKIIQERHKDDRSKMNEELMDLYRKHKVNPLGGCLPMLLQIPVFIALYHALFFSIELRGAPFMLWIQDLSQQDPYFVTPVFMGATMILQQKMTPSAMDPVQQKIMMMMPIVFTFLFITFPAGLVIYWTTNNLLTIAQQYYIYKIAKD